MTEKVVQRDRKRDRMKDKEEKSCAIVYLKFLSNELAADFFLHCAQERKSFAIKKIIHIQSKELLFF